jgi:ligand-binding SRPBCC domain-containing protein
LTQPSRLESEQWVPRPVAEVFTFFGEPQNLARLTPGWLGFEILTPPPVPMRQGALIDYLIRLGPLPTRWRTLITTFAPPHKFVDEQLSGPYSFWHHTHEFIDQDGGTLIRDRVLYLLPLGLLGRVVERLVIRRQLRAIFSYRQRVIAEIFPGEEHDSQENKTRPHG